LDACLILNYLYGFPFLLLIAILFQVARLNSSYPGGLVSYIKTARELLADSKAGKNPFDGFTPSVSEYTSHAYKLMS
jgi:hypothetical protein